MTDTAPLTVVNVLAYIGYVAGFAGLLWLLVHGQRLLAKAHPSLRIVVPEQSAVPSNVVVLADRKAS